MYLTDAVRLAAENAARIGGGNGLRQRWADILPRDRGPVSEAGNRGERGEELRAVLSLFEKKAGIRVCSGGLGGPGADDGTEGSTG